MKYNRVILISIDSLGKKYSQPFEKYFNKNYLNYRTTNTWTLPSHLAMLAGVVCPSLFYPFEYEKNDKYENYIPFGLPTIATYFKKQGFKTRAITGGGWMSKYFGWGKDWDIWQEADTDEKAWNGEKIIPEENTLLFLHTYYVHNWWDEDKNLKKKIAQEYWKKMKKLPNRDGYKISYSHTFKKLIEKDGKAYYFKRIEKIAKKLKWIEDLDEKALVVLTSDHGDLFFEDGESLFHGFTSLYNSEIFEVPLLVRDHDNKQDKIKENVYLYDYFLPRFLCQKVGIELNQFLEIFKPETTNSYFKNPYVVGLKQELKMIKSSRLFKLSQYYYKFRDKIKLLFVP